MKDPVCREFRPIPVQFQNQDYKMGYPETSCSMFPMAPRNYFRNLLLSQYPDLQKIRAKIYYNHNILDSRYNEFPKTRLDDLKYLVADYPELPIYPHFLHQLETQGQNSKADSSVTDFEQQVRSSFSPATTRSHPAWDPSGHWVLSVEFLDDHDRTQKQPPSIRLAVARYIKEFLKLTQAMELESLYQFEQFPGDHPPRIFGNTSRKDLTFLQIGELQRFTHMFSEGIAPEHRMAWLVRLESGRRQFPFPRHGSTRLQCLS